MTCATGLLEMAAHRVVLCAGVEDERDNEAVETQNLSDCMSKGATRVAGRNSVSGNVLVAC